LPLRVWEREPCKPIGFLGRLWCCLSPGAQAGQGDRFPFCNFLHIGKASRTTSKSQTVADLHHLSFTHLTADIPQNKRNPKFFFSPFPSTLSSLCEETCSCLILSVPGTSLPAFMFSGWGNPACTQKLRPASPSPRLTRMLTQPFWGQAIVFSSNKW